MSDGRLHCVVVGAGIVGITTGIELIKRGLRVTLIDPEFPGSQASSGNAGGIAIPEVMPIASPGILRRVPGWMLDPCGPLALRPGHLFTMLPWLWRFHRESSLSRVEHGSRALASLLLRSGADTRSVVSEAGMDHLLTANGAIAVYSSKQAFDRDRLEWDIKKSRGVALEYLDRASIGELEPRIANAICGWLMPQWFNTTDPKLLIEGLCDFYKRQGGTLMRDRATDFTCKDRCVTAVELEHGASVKADVYIMAAGVWSSLLCKLIGEPVLLESERGYNATLPAPGYRPQHQIIFAEEKFVCTNIGDGLRIGGGAEFAGIAAPANSQRSRRLLEMSKKYLPGIKTEGATWWMGQRPSTPDSLPVISRSGRFTNLLHNFGHGHLGMTLAATSAILVTSLALGETTPMNASPFDIRRFA